MLIGEKYHGMEFKDPASVAAVMAGILGSEDALDQDKEHFWTIGLDCKNYVKYIELCSLGILNSAVVHAREVFRRAISHGVANIIVCHNHPSGHASPSREDKEITTRLEQAGEILGIKLLDHIIISASGDFISFKAIGLM